MEDVFNSGGSHDLKDLESKVGMKIPESLLRSLKGGCACAIRAPDSDERLAMILPQGLSEKIRSLKVNMEQLRSTDVYILRQLLSLHEGMENLRWLQGDRSAITSLTGSLAGSQSSLAEVASVNQGTGSDSLDCHQDMPTEPLQPSACCSPSGLMGNSAPTEDSRDDHNELWAKAAHSICKPAIFHESSLEGSLLKKPNAIVSIHEPQCAGSAELCQMFDSKPDRPESGHTDLCKDVIQSVEWEPELSLGQSEAMLGYDTHWCWVESKDDITFL